ncbi:hypothetical protein BpHYR1_039862 [Brachionus plicatilis]|uniref:Uncharacterized protein n=1 Tax=Brachionus plicatilis TaxID=10195 RepID=A0A3M7RKA1_BRAPC|nr:hypothetical protein BpHYR1_039862 [Brachionus plicatilis]
MSRKKRTIILIVTKIAIVKEKLKTEKSDDDLATEFKIDRSTASKIIKEKEKYLNYKAENGPADKKESY